MTQFRSLLCFTLLLLTTTILPVRAAFLDEEILRSVVFVVAVDDEGNIGMGSGTMFSETLILTNAHVITGEDGEVTSDIAIAFTVNSKELPQCVTIVDVIAYDLALDLAILEPIEHEENECQTDTSFVGNHDVYFTNFRQEGLFQSEIPDLSEEVTIVGYPGISEGSLTVTSGNVSGYYRDGNRIVGLQTDAQVNPGNSGGAAFDDAGNFVGVPTITEFDTSVVAKFGGIISLNVINDWLDELEQDGILITTNEEDVLKEQTECFPDVGSSHPNVIAICTLKREHVIGGYPDGTFQPRRTLNRAELLKVLILGGIGIEPSIAEYNNCFPDVTDEWFAPFVCYAKVNGIVDGYPDGTFKPDKTVNRAETLKMTLSALDLVLPTAFTEQKFTDVPRDAWFAPFVDTAVRLNLLQQTGSRLDPAGGISRAELSEIIYRILIILKHDLAYFGEEKQSQETHTNEQAYSDFIYGVTIENAPSWTRSGDSPDHVVTFTNPLNAEVRVTYVVETLSQGFSNESYFQHAEDHLETFFTNYQLLQKHPTEVSGLRALDITYSADIFNDDTIYQATQRIVVHNQIAYIFSYIAPQHLFLDHVDDAMQIIESVEILE